MCLELKKKKKKNTLKVNTEHVHTGYLDIQPQNQKKLGQYGKRK